MKIIVFGGYSNYKPTNLLIDKLIYQNIEINSKCLMCFSNINTKQRINKDLIQIFENYNNKDLLENGYFKILEIRNKTDYYYLFKNISNDGKLEEFIIISSDGKLIIYYSNNECKFLEKNII